MYQTIIYRLMFTSSKSVHLASLGFFSQWSFSDLLDYRYSIFDMIHSPLLKQHHDDEPFGHLLWSGLWPAIFHDVFLFSEKLLWTPKSQFTFNTQIFGPIHLIKMKVKFQLKLCKIKIYQELSKVLNSRFSLLNFKLW